MKNLRNWAAVTALAIFVAGAVALEAQPTGWLSHFTNSSSGTVQFRALSSYGRPVLVGHGTGVPTAGNDGAAPMDGELYVVHAASTDPDFQLYNANSAAWETVANLDTTTAQTFAGALTVTGAQTFTGAATFNGSVTLGNNEDDLVTVNAPTQYNVFRTDFEFVGLRILPNLFADGTTDVGDTNINLWFLQGAPGPLGLLWQRYEIAFGGTFAPELFFTGGTDADGEGKVLLIDSASLLDVNNDDAIEFAIGGDPDDTVLWDESSGLDAYCEISVRIDDISDISAGDFYFGWFINAAIDDTFAFTSSNTWAAFQVNDVAGDLQICAEEDGDTHGCDDAGQTIADDGDYVMRVEVSADAVAFYLDGTAVAATNAIMDADDDETYTCRFGVRSAGTSAATIELEYIEIGYEQ